MTTEEKRQVLIEFCRLHEECEQPGFECPLFDVGDCLWESDGEYDAKDVETCYDVLVKAGVLKEEQSKRMVMSDEEICVQYRDAKHKQQQVGILADMNACTKREMIEKLIGLGLMKKPDYGVEFERRCEELYTLGFCDAEIAEQVGELKSKVVAWRKSKGLSAHYPSQKRRKEEAPASESPVQVSSKFSPSSTQVSPKSDPSPSQVSPKEMVTHPAHYNKGGIECIDALDAMVTGYTDPVDAVLSWQTVKYIWRHPFKGKPLEDLKKAQFYLSRLIKRLEADDD